MKPFPIDVVMATRFVSMGISETAIESFSLRGGLNLSNEVFDQLLCPSEMDSLSKSKNKSLIISSFSNSFGTITQPIDLHVGCLFLLLRDYKTSFTFQATNLCNDKTYRLWFNIETKQHISLNPLPIVSDLPPFKVRYLTSTVYVSFIEMPLFLRYKTNYSLLEM